LNLLIHNINLNICSRITTPSAGPRWAVDWNRVVEGKQHSHRDAPKCLASLPASAIGRHNWLWPRVVISLGTDGPPATSARPSRHNLKAGCALSGPVAASAFPRTRIGAAGPLPLLKLGSSPLYGVLPHQPGLSPTLPWPPASLGGINRYGLDLPASADRESAARYRGWEGGRTAPRRQRYDPISGHAPRAPVRLPGPRGRTSDRDAGSRARARRWKHRAGRVRGICLDSPASADPH
jgi:hypothetical protein